MPKAAKTTAHKGTHTVWRTPSGFSCQHETPQHDPRHPAKNLTPTGC